jgi:hypothetical protein
MRWDPFDVSRRAKIITTVIALLVFVASTTGLIWGHPGTAVAILLTILSGLATAILGSSLALDYSQTMARDHAVVSTRQLFDQLKRLQALTEDAEARGNAVRRNAESNAASPLDEFRVADWFMTVGAALRNEIESTTTAIRSWEDLAPAVFDRELQKYGQMEGRLSAAMSQGWAKELAQEQDEQQEAVRRSQSGEQH